MNSNNELDLPIIDESKFQILNISIKDPKGETISLPLPMPYIFAKDVIPDLQIENIQISEPRDIPGYNDPNFKFEEISQNGGEQVQETDSGEVPGEDSTPT